MAREAKAQRAQKSAPVADTTKLETRIAAARAALAAGRIEEAERELAAVKSAGRGDARYHTLRGQTLRALKQPAEAAVELEAALRADPDSLIARVFRGLVRLDLREPALAREDFAEAVARAPGDAEHHRLLAIAARRCEDFEASIAAYREAVRLAPARPQLWVDLSVIYEELGRLAEVAETLEKGLQTVGAHRTIVEALCAFLRRRGRYAQAVEWLTKLLESNESVGWLHRQIALCLQASDRDRANVHFARACELEPKDARTLTDYIDSLNRTRSGDEGELLTLSLSLAKRRLDLGGDLVADARPLLGIFLRAGDFDSVDRIGDFDKLGAAFAATGADTALQLLISQARTPAHRRLLVEWHRACGDRMIAGARRIPLPASPPVGGRAKLRVGFVSSDLRDHPVGYFFKPLIENFDRSKFEIYGYSWYPKTDAAQEAFAKLMDGFHRRPDIGVRDAAALMAADNLDILIDAGGSTDQNKLAALAWKPAPRIASWIAYPHSAGLTTIDRIVVDPYIEPKDPKLLIEKPLRLARSWVTFSRPELEPYFPIAAGTPEERAGYLTFGTMNNPVKFNRDLLAAWAEILRQTPNSRFLFVRPEGATSAFRENMCAAFELGGVARDRILFTPVRGLHLPAYNQMDISLDTFPQSGNTTTCESLWMGTPCVTLVGEAFFERLSYSTLANAGLAHLCAFSREDYIRIAVELAKDSKRRAYLHRTLRQRLKDEPLGDAQGVTRDFEAALIAWRDEGGV